MARQVLKEPREISLEEALGALNPVERAKAPDRIWAQGDLDLLRGGIRVSIVGTREPTKEGRARAAKAAKILVENGITVVSGLARGIDTIAHVTAIGNGGRTVAVLGTSLDRCYPRENRKLQELIAHQHLVISMFPPGTPTRRWHFPQRNRLMALVSHATVIIEAGSTSGTISQAWEAVRLGRRLLLPRSLADRADELEWVCQILEYGAEVFSSPDELLEALPTPMEEDLAIAL